MRPETGTMKFGDDWTGIFIRGDNAFHFAMILEGFINHPEDPIARAAITGLLETLRDSNEATTTVGPQRLKPFSECIAEVHP